MQSSTERTDGTNGAGPKGLIVYSSKTGNTRKLAEGIHRGLTEALGAGQGGRPALRLAAVEEAPDPADADWVLVGFWADRGTADQKALRYLQSLEGRRIGLFGTLGAYPDSDHARDTQQKVRDLAAEKNTVLGSFMCQGKIDPALTERFRNLPADNPHAMTEERMKRHLEAAKHPDEEDLRAGTAACLAMVQAAVPAEAAVPAGVSGVDA
jgi:flavodoxin